jgi:putative ABC transport system permease protein
MRDGIAQIAAVVLAATAVGTGIGAGIVALLAGGPVPVELSPPSMLTSALLLAVTSVLGSLATFRRITRIEPAIALGGEA